MKKGSPKDAPFRVDALILSLDNVIAYSTKIESHLHLNNRVSQGYGVVLGLTGVFLMTGKRARGVRARPVGQPGDFPRVCGGAAGVPI